MSSDTHNTLGNGEWLLVGHSLWSNDGSVEFKMQTDGKIACYWGGECQYQNTAQQRYDVKGIKMQSDGNLAIFNNDGQRVWSTDLEGQSGDSTVICAVQDDGNVVLYRGTPIWATNTQKP